MSYRLRVCRNPRCQDDLDKVTDVIPLCPSCRLIGKMGLAVGAILAGMLMKVFA